MKKEFRYSKKNDRWFPTVDIIIRSTKKISAFRALVDSGASYSLFRPEVAEHLGIQIDKGKQIYLKGIGKRILGYMHNLQMSIDGKKFFNCKVVFSKEHSVSFNILGRDNFFIPFLITFNEKFQNVVVEENE